MLIWAYIAYKTSIKLKKDLSSVVLDDSCDTGDVFLVFVEILEGEVLKGTAKGFARKIKYARGTSFLGDFDGDRLLGKCIFIEDYEVVYQVKWSAQ